ncbi:MAG: hypothetical protein AB7G12_08010, partial [Thermoanaerobaculia bacterium]
AQPIPPNGATWQVAPGGTIPLWSADGTELNFSGDDELFSVPVSTAGTFSAGTPRRLAPLSHSIVPTTDTATAYDISPGGRFLAVKSDTDANAGKHLIVGLHWTDRLPQLLSGVR